MAKEVVNSTGNLVSAFKKTGDFIGKTVETFGMFQGIYGNIDALQLQRNYMWQVILPDETGSDSTISSRVLAVDFSGAEFSSINSMNMGPRLRKEPGKYQVPNLRLSILEDENGLVWDYMINWWSKILPDSTGSLGVYAPQSMYKRKVAFHFLSTFGVKRKEFTAMGCFPIAQPVYNMSYGDNKLTVIDIRVSVDEVMLPGQNNVGLGALQSFFNFFK